MRQTAELLELAPRDVAQDEPQTSSTARRIEVSTPEEPSAEQRLRIIELSGSLDFWLDSREVDYGPEDGTAI